MVYFSGLRYHCCGIVHNFTVRTYTSPHTVTRRSPVSWSWGQWPWTGQLRQAIEVVFARRTPTGALYNFVISWLKLTNHNSRLTIDCRILSNRGPPFKGKAGPKPKGKILRSNLRSLERFFAVHHFCAKMLTFCFLYDDFWSFLNSSCASDLLHLREVGQKTRPHLNVCNSHSHTW